MSTQAPFALAMCFTSTILWFSGGDSSPEPNVPAAPAESQAESASQNSPTASAPGDIDAATIAEKFDERYRNAKFLYLEGQTITSTGEHLRYVHHTSQDSMRTVCYSGDEMLAAFSLHEGRVQEFVPSHPNRLVLEYDADDDDWMIPNRVYRDPRDCLFGYCFAIRIGPKTAYRQNYVDRFRESTLRGQEKVGDSLCYVLDWSRQGTDDKGDQLAMKWVYWIDVDDYAIRRRHVTYSTTRDGQEIHREERDFLYDLVELFDNEQPIDWDIRPIAENAPKPEPEAHQ